MAILLTSHVLVDEKQHGHTGPLRRCRLSLSPLGPVLSKGRFRVRISDLYFYTTFGENSLFDLAFADLLYAYTMPSLA